MSESYNLIPEKDYIDACNAVREQGGSSSSIIRSSELGPAIRAIPKGELDPHTLFLLHGDKIEDASIYHHKISNLNVISKNDNVLFNKNSLYFKNGAKLSTNVTFNNQWTIDWWEYLPHSLNNYGNIFYVGSSSNHMLLAYASNTVTIWDDPWRGDSISNQHLNQWTHRALVNDGSQITVFENGKKIKTILKNNNFTDNTITIGARRDYDTQNWEGYISEFRISDIPRWTKDFVLEDKPYDNLTQSIINPITITKNGTYDAVKEKIDGFNPIIVNCPTPKLEQAYNKTYTANGSYPVTPDAGKVISGGTIDVNCPGPKPEEFLDETVDKNGQWYFRATPGRVISKIRVNVAVPAASADNDVWVELTNLAGMPVCVSYRGTDNTPENMYLNPETSITIVTKSNSVIAFSSGEGISNPALYLCNLNNAPNIEAKRNGVYITPDASLADGQAEVEIRRG